MFFGRGKQPPPQLTEDDLAAMAKARDEASGMSAIYSSPGPLLRN